MSQENVEIVRRIYRAAARRDSGAVLSEYDSAVEWDISHHPLRPMFGADIYRGTQGLRDFFREWYAAWDDIENHVEELIDAGESVVAVVTDHARGLASGAEVTWAHAAVWTIDDGRVIRVLWLPTRAEALEAVGLTE
jgi:ketosteroid isomerase-like protein